MEPIKKINNLTILLPSKNHEAHIIKNIDKLISFCEKNVDEYEILVVSNGSSFEMTNIFDKVSYSYFRQEILEESGKGLAVRHGIQKARYDNILIYDSDFSYSIDLLIKFYDTNKEPLAPFMYVQRELSKDVVSNTPILRVIAGILFNFLVRVLLKIQSKDTQAGFKFVNKERFVNVLNFKSNDFSYDLELFLLAKRINLKTHFITVSTINKSSYSNVGLLSDSLSMFLKLFKLRKLYKKI
tara:strand:- start:29135 stop:29857 length:723 start_codon:yes stop_codon:yes gene_type:complete